MQRSGTEHGIPLGAEGKRLQRVALIAGGVQLVYLCAFWAIGMPGTGLMNLMGAAVQAVAWQLLCTRRNRWAVWLMSTEILVHACVSTLLLGWDAGIHAVLALFVPVAFAALPARKAWAAGVGVLALYLALDVASMALDPVLPLPGAAARGLRWLNTALVFGALGWAGLHHVRSLREGERRLALHLTTDPMTGLLNRRHFLEMASREVSKADRSGEPLVIALIDIDLFKQVNDEHGQEAGDKVICHVASLLASGVRDADLVGRWGGEEFILLLPGTGIEGATQLCERLRDRIERSPVEAGPGVVPVTVSIGLSGLDVPASLDDSIQGADRALYGAKAEGRNRICLRADLRAANASSGDRPFKAPPKPWRR